MESFNKILPKYNKYIYTLSLNYGQSDPVIISELYEQGLFGLYTAYKTFNEEKDITFLGYAHFWIKKNQLDYLTKLKSKIFLENINTFMKDI